MINNKFKNGLIGWIGGKKILRKTIAPLIPADIDSYIEPFGGAAWVMLYKEKWADLEIYNDLDGRLVNLFRIVKYHPKAFIEEIKYLLGSREMFTQYLNGTFLTDIQRAVQFFFIVTRSFGGNCRTFGVSRRKMSSACRTENAIMEKVNCIHERFERVLIENRDFETLIKQYDYEGAFFYCDPPYSCGTGYATTSTKKFEHERLKNVLDNVKGRFLLSYDDSPKIRNLYKDYEMIEVARHNGINHRLDATHKKVYNELLIANYPIKDVR